MCWCVLGRLWYSRLRCLIGRFLLFQNYILRISFCRLMSIFKHNLVKSFVWLRKRLLLITFARWDLRWPRLEIRNKNNSSCELKRLDFHFPWVVLPLWWLYSCFFGDSGVSLFRTLTGCVRRCQAPLHQEVEWSPLLCSPQIQQTFGSFCSSRPGKQKCSEMEACTQ